MVTNVGSTPRRMMLDSSATRYTAQAGRIGYGTPIGILCVDCTVPFLPGDVGNASTYDYPVVYRLVPGATSDAVINEKDHALIPNFIEAAEYLVGQGVRAITGDCGYMVTYQREVADAVDVPVFLSSLLQIPLILRFLKSSQKLAVIVANEISFTPDLLEAAGLTLQERSRLVVRGVQSKPHCRQVILEESGVLDLDVIRDEVVAVAEEMLDEDRAIGAYMLECSELPVYSAAIQRATGLPVFDWISFIDYVEHSVVARTYKGIF